MSASSADRIENYLVCPFSRFEFKKQQIWLKKNTYLVFSIISCRRALLIKQALSLLIKLKTLQLLIKGFKDLLLIKRQ
ncbi:MAG TPA: hypothetical protein PK583_01800 [Gammaproteobacteria bacterium]|nr:hypothetical protein [Gammaproteobacteria bacterium]HRA43281.1 hypothetical protein [Gammaproteobacteria bacterium]